MGSTGSDSWVAAATDSSGNIYRAGSYHGTVAVAGIGSFTANGAGFDWMVQKVSPAGTILWAIVYGPSAADDAPYRIAVNGTMVAVGGRVGTASGDAVVMGLNASTGATRFVKTFGSTSSDEAYGVVVDASENVFASGYFRGSVDFGGGFTLTDPFSTDLDFFIVKYNSSGVTQTARHYCNDGNDRAYGMAIDSSGNLAIVGTFSNSIDFTQPSTTTISGSCFTGTGPAAFTSTNAQSDGFVLALDSSLGLRWAKQITGVTGTTTGNESAIAVLIDAAGGVIATGNTVEDLNIGAGNMTRLGNSDAWLGKWNSAGVIQWSKRLGGTGNDYGDALALATSNAVRLVGGFEGTASFGSGSLTTAGANDGYMASFTSAGTGEFSAKYGGSVADRAQGVATTTSNRPAVVGYFNGTGTFAGVSLTSAGTADAFTAVSTVP